MKRSNFLSRALKRYRNDERGNIAMTFGSILVILVACVGAGYDMNQLTSTKYKASSVADTIALTAAVFYSANDRIPLSTEEGYVHDHEYDVADLNYTFNSLSTKNARNVKMKVTYDLDEKEATVRVYGHTEVAFMQIFGHQKMNFEAVSVAKFSEVELKNPASVMLVLDNSGSMWFDDLPNTGNGSPQTINPAAAERRITALKTAVNTLMSQLDGIAGPQTVAGERFLRTGMQTYSSQVLNTSIPMKWGTLTTSDVATMQPGGGTNSSPPMQGAANELELETDAHANDKFGTPAYPGDEPVKFLIFMTDGQNNNNANLDEWEAASGTGLWRRWEEEPGYYSWTCHWWGCHNHWYEGTSGWEYEDSETSPSGSGWEEGLMTGNLDRMTRETCNQMRDDGVKVFSVGFALQDGWFDTNEWGAGNNDSSDDTFFVHKKVKRAAVHMMQQCAGAENPQRFMLSEDAESLEQAFEDIGLQIVKEVIRIAS